MLTVSTFLISKAMDSDDVDLSSDGEKPYSETSRTSSGTESTRTSLRDGRPLINSDADAQLTQNADKSQMKQVNVFLTSVAFACTQVFANE